MSKSMMIDIDDTVANFSKRATEMLNHIKCLPRGGKDMVSVFEFKTEGTSPWDVCDDEFRQLMLDGHIFEHLKPFDGAVDWVNDRFKEGWDIVFCTARGFYPNAEKMTMEWLGDHGFAYDNLWVVDSARDKQELNKMFDVVIDDNIKCFDPESTLHNDFIDNSRFLIDPIKLRNSSNRLSDFGFDNNLDNIDVIFGCITFIDPSLDLDYPHMSSTKRF